MNLRILRYEMVMILRNPGVLFSLMLLGALVGCATLYQVQGMVRRELQLSEIFAEFQHKRDLAAAELARVERGETTYDSMWKDPRGFYTWQEQLIRYPEHPLNFLAVGQQDLVSPLVAVGIFKPAEPEGRDLANPMAAMIGALDPAFILVFLLPLFVIGFAAGIVSKERESGALPLLLMQPGGLKGLVAHKITPRLTILFVTVVLPLMTVAVAAGVDLRPHVAQLLWLAAFTFAYLLFWFLAAAVTNLWFRETFAHITAMMGLWCLLCILLPVSTVSLATWLFPKPGHAEWVNTARAVSREQQAQAQKILDQYYQDHPELTVQADPTGEYQDYFTFYQRSLTVGFEVERALQPTIALYRQQKHKQERLTLGLTQCSPPFLFAQFLVGLAGSSGEQYGQFSESVEQYSRERRNHFLTKAFAGELITSADPSRLPQFLFQIPFHPWQWALNLALLLGFNLFWTALFLLNLRGRADYEHLKEVTL